MENIIATVARLVGFAAEVGRCVFSGENTGFRPLLRGWLRSGQLVRFIRGVRACRAFRRWQPQVYANFNDDQHVSQEMRNRLVRSLESLDSYTKEAIESRVESFCWSGTNQRQGPESPGSRGATFGHVMETGKLRKVFTSTQSPTSAFTPKDQLRLFRDLIDRDNLTQQRAAIGVFPEYQMFGFFQLPHLHDPFAGVSTKASELRRRLGLGKVDPDEELLHFAYRLRDDQIAHIPTAADADLDPYFRPGGYTKPLWGDDDGLPEVVHTPIDGSQLQRRIERAT